MNYQTAEALRYRESILWLLIGAVVKITGSIFRSINIFLALMFEVFDKLEDAQLEKEHKNENI